MLSEGLTARRQPSKYDGEGGIRTAMLLGPASKGLDDTTAADLYDLENYFGFVDGSVKPQDLYRPVTPEQNPEAYDYMGQESWDRMKAGLADVPYASGEVFPLPGGFAGYEVSDAHRTLNRPQGAGLVKLPDVLGNSEDLFTAYPSLRDISVAFEDEVGSHGSFDPGTNTLYLSQQPDADMLDTLIHETQHAIDIDEGRPANSYVPSETYLDTVAEFQQKRPANWEKTLSGVLNRMSRPLMNDYLRDASEVNARMAGVRRTLPPKDLRENPPNTWLDVPVDQIVTTEDGFKATNQYLEDRKREPMAAVIQRLLLERAGPK
jgi:hypothetical protein